MRSTLSRTYTASLLSLVFLGNCYSRAPSPALRTPSDFQHSSLFQDSSLLQNSSLSQNSSLFQNSSLSQNSSLYQNSSLFESNGIIQPQVDIELSGEELSEEWLIAVAKGRSLYDAWEQGGWPNPDRRDAALYSGDTHPQPARITDAQMKILRRFLLDTDNIAEDFSGYDYSGPAAAGDDTDHVWFKCDVSARKRAILVTGWGDGDDTERDLTNADILWSMWEKDVQSLQLRSEDSPLRSYEAKDLESVYYDPVEEPLTLALLKYAMSNQPTEDFQSWPYEDFRPDADDTWARENVYWALLGSPAGANVQALLTEHKRTLAKHVEMIFAVRRVPPQSSESSESGPSRPPSAADDPEPMQYALVFKLGYPRPINPGEQEDTCQEHAEQAEEEGDEEEDEEEEDEEDEEQGEHEDEEDEEDGDGEDQDEDEDGEDEDEDGQEEIREEEDGEEDED